MKKIHREGGRTAVCCVPLFIVSSVEPSFPRKRIQNLRDCEQTQRQLLCDLFADPGVYLQPQLASNKDTSSTKLDLCNSKNKGDED